MIDIRMSSEQDRIPWETVSALGPHIIWLLFAIGILWWIGRSRLDAFLERVQKVNIAGVEVELRQTLEQAVSARGEAVSPIVIGRAARRLAQSTKLLAGARLLWVDDEPNGVRFERELLEEAGAIVNDAISSDQASRLIDRTVYDLILSDIRRGDDGKAGIQFLQVLRDRGLNTPVIFYVGQVSNSTPEGAFGITDTPDELVHLVLDALARRRS